MTDLFSIKSEITELHSKVERFTVEPSESGRNTSRVEEWFLQTTPDLTQLSDPSEIAE